MIGKTYASADWHGCGEIGKRILDYLKPEDTLYFLGDAMDRGEDGIELFNLLTTRPNTIYLKGNHEDIMYRALVAEKAFFEDRGYVQWSGWEAGSWFSNGGTFTLTPLKKGEKTIYDLFNMIPKLNNLLTSANYYSLEGRHSVILEHAGGSPFIPIHQKHDPLWDRNHFNDPWTIKHPTIEQQDTYLVHGHTPIQYLKYEYGYKGQLALTAEDLKNQIKWFKNENITEVPKIIRYCDGHKFDIDLCTVASKRAVLLDLDTFEEIYFEE